MNNRRATYHANQAGRSARPTVVGKDGDRFIVTINGETKKVTAEELMKMAGESNHDESS